MHRIALLFVNLVLAFFNRQMKCEVCKINNAVVKRSKDRLVVCKTCFFEMFEQEVHTTIVENELFSEGEKIAVGVSGGKDSTVLAYVLNLLNKRHNYGIDIYMLSVDEGIKGYRDNSLETVEQNKRDYNLPLKIVSFDSYFGSTMDSIVSKVGRKGNCTFCGVFRRQALEKGARELGCTQIITGHNADDMAETVLMNLLRGDYTRLKKSTMAKTTSKETNLPRSKPFKYVYEKDIVMYAFHRNLRYFSTECTYSPGAYRGTVRLYVKDLAMSDPQSILNIIKSGEYFESDKSIQTLYKCKLCSESTSSKTLICKACEFIDILANK